MLKKLFLMTSFLLIFSSCAFDITEKEPKKDDIFSVSDFYIFKDAKHALFFNSDFNLAYAHGSLSVLKLDSKNGSKVENFILTDKLGGKIIVSKDEKTVFLTSRGENLLTKLTISKDKSGTPKLSYSKKTLEDSSLELQDEPYSLCFSKDEKFVFVSDLKDGNISVVNSKTNKLEDVFKFAGGITDIIYNKFYDVYIVSYRTENFLTLFKFVSNKDKVSISKQKLQIEDSLGTGVFSLSQNTEDNTLFISYKNLDTLGKTSPQLQQLELVQDEETGEFSLKTKNIVSLPEIPAEVSNNDDFVFIPLTSDETLLKINQETGAIFDKLDLSDEDCNPYQIISQKELLLVSCFDAGKVLLIDGGNFSNALKIKEVIK